MSENKKISCCILGILLCAIVAIYSIHGYDTAYANTTLTAAATPNQTAVYKIEQRVLKELKQLAKAEGYSDIIQWEKKVVNVRQKQIKIANKQIKKWKKYLTKKQVRKAYKNVNKIRQAHTLTSIRDYGKRISKICAKGKQLKKSRIECRSLLSGYLKDYNDLLNATQKKKIKTWLSKIDALNVKKINKVKERAAKIIRSAAGITGVDVTGWSIDKIKYVKEWGRKNNSFLSGTPMAGLGNYIAKGAYEHNVDPALLSSIAYIESKCGNYPYGSRYNAYGWVCGTPSMSSWEDGIDKWYNYFGQYFGGDIPVSSMHGYGGYGVGSIAGCLSQIRNA